MKFLLLALFATVVLGNMYCTRKPRLEGCSLKGVQVRRKKTGSVPCYEATAVAKCLYYRTKKGSWFSRICKYDCDRMIHEALRNIAVKKYEEKKRQKRNDDKGDLVELSVPSAPLLRTVTDPLRLLAKLLEEEVSGKCGYNYDFNHCYATNQAECMTQKNGHWYQRPDVVYKVGDRCYKSLSSCLNCLNIYSPILVDNHGREHLRLQDCGKTSGCPVYAKPPARDGSRCELTNDKQQSGGRPSFPHSGGRPSLSAKSGATVDGECCAKNMLSFSKTSHKLKCCKYGRRKDPNTHELTCNEKPAVVTLDKLVALINQDPSEGKGYSREAIHDGSNHGVRLNSLEKFKSNNGKFTAKSIGELFMDYNQDGVGTEDSNLITKTAVILKKMFKKAPIECKAGWDTCADPKLQCSGGRCIKITESELEDDSWLQ